MVSFRTGVRRKEEVGELAGIGIIAFKLIQPTHRLHANIVIGMGEQHIAILIGAGNGGSSAVKGQSDKAIGKTAEIGSAAIGIRFDCILAVNITCHHRGQLLKSSFGIVLAHESGTIIQPCLLIFVRQNHRPQFLIAAC